MLTHFRITLQNSQIFLNNSFHYLIMNIVILAAGMGKRMHSQLPKVLQPLAGRPMLDYVLEAVEAFGAVKTIVVGHCAEEVKQHCADREDVQFALQMP